jgi:hypothetical protein
VRDALGPLLRNGARSDRGANIDQHHPEARYELLLRGADVRKVEPDGDESGNPDPRLHPIDDAGVVHASTSTDVFVGPGSRSYGSGGVQSSVAFRAIGGRAAHPIGAAGRCSPRRPKAPQHGRGDIPGAAVSSPKR